MASHFQLEVELNKYGIPTTDVGFKLIKACDYQYWKQGERFAIPIFGRKPGVQKRIRLGAGECNSSQEVVPVGTIEFVEKCLRRPILPINIPNELTCREFLNRKLLEYPIGNSSENSLGTVLMQLGLKRAFVKRADRLKKFCEIVNAGHGTAVEPGVYLISEDIEKIAGHKIEAEWRVLVYKGNIVGCKHYSGNPYAIPPENMIKAMVSKFKSCPPAYTLDVATTDVIGRQAFLIEVHNFISCGLYGFEALDILPQMTIRSWLWEKQHTRRI